MKNQIIIKNKIITLKEKIGELCYCFVSINGAKQSNQEDKVLIPASFWSRFQRNPNYANKVLINEFVKKKSVRIIQNLNRSSIKFHVSWVENNSLLIMARY